MSIETKNQKDNKKTIDSVDLNFKYFKIYIQCPNCGDLLKVNKDRKYFCKYCNHQYTENEIRENCGL